MFGQDATMNAAWTTIRAATAGTAPAPFSRNAATADPANPTWSAVSRPILVSAMWPHTGFASIRASAVHASTSPIWLSSSPWKSRR
jgi:hypothetical protein